MFFINYTSVANRRCISKPTIILSECVLVYLPPRDSDALIQFLSTQFTTATMVVYEQILPHDPFGKQMLKNLSVSNSLHLLSVAC